MHALSRIGLCTIGAGETEWVDGNGSLVAARPMVVRFDVSIRFSLQVYCTARPHQRINPDYGASRASAALCSSDVLIGVVMTNV